MSKVNNLSLSYVYMCRYVNRYFLLNKYVTNDCLNYVEYTCKHKNCYDIKISS